VFTQGQSGKLTCRLFDFSRRREKLAWGHHREVASLPRRRQVGHTVQRVPNLFYCPLPLYDDCHIV